MIEYTSESIFDIATQTRVNPVNTIGVSGAGLALQFKRRYPLMQQAFKRRCDDGFGIGDLFFWSSGREKIVCFPTKEHWVQPSSLTFIEMGLETFCREYKEHGVTEAAFPALGCGFGGLEWDEVRPVMERTLRSRSRSSYAYRGSDERLVG